MTIWIKALIALVILYVLYAIYLGQIDFRFWDFPVRNGFVTWYVIGMVVIALVDIFQKAE